MGSMIQNPLQPCLFHRGFAAQKNQKLHHLQNASRDHFQCNSIYKPSSFNYSGSAGVPLHELPGASFDQYMENKGRILKSIFPEKSSHQQLNEEEWKIKMNPIQALFLTFQPVAHITAKCISKADDDCTPHIPCHITKFFEVQITRCEFPDLHIDYMPGDFKIKGRGALYLERKGKLNWMKNHLDINLNITFPPLLAWVPENLLQNIAQSVLNTYVEEINNGFAVRLLADYNSFKRNMLKTKCSL